MPGTCAKYSFLSVNRPAKPRCQPSIIASENAHAQDVTQAIRGSDRHESRCATMGPHIVAARPSRTAGPVPQPTWASNQPKIGAAAACQLKLSGAA